MCCTFVEKDNLANQVLDTLARYNVRPDQINLEITETAASYSQKTMLENLSILDEAGVHFALDDFGTGHSNMKRIASLPLYLVKLDKSFANVEDNPRPVPQDEFVRFIEENMASRNSY